MLPLPALFTSTDSSTDSWPSSVEKENSRRALHVSPNTSDDSHRQTRELSIDGLDTRVSQMLVFPERESFFRGRDPLRQDRGKTTSRPQETIALELPLWGTPIIKREY